jgi:hypothetical protein
MSVILTEQDVEGLYGSKSYSGADIGDRKIRAEIAHVSKETFPARGNEPARTKLVVALVGHQKSIVLNSTNFTVLRDGISRNPGEWVGAEIGISAEPTSFGGKSTMGLRVKVLKRPEGVAAAKAAPTAAAGFDEPVPF